MNKNKNLRANQICTEVFKDEDGCQSEFLFILVDKISVIFE